MALVDPFAEPAQEVQPRQEQPKKPRLVDPFAKQTGLVDPWAPQQAPPPPEPPKKDYSYLESAGRNIKGGYAELASGLGTVSGYLGERLDSDTLRQTGESMKSYWDQVAEGAPPSQAAQVSPLDDPKVLADPKWWIENTARMAPSFAVPLGVGAGGMKIASKALPGLPRIATAIGAGVGGLFGGTIEGAQTYEEGLELGKDESTAASAGEAMALGSAVLNALPFYKIMNPSARGVVYNFVTRGMTEGVTEAMEEPLDEIIQGLVYDKEMDWEEVAKRAAHVAPPAFLLGGVGGAGGGRGRSPEEGQPEDIHATPEQSIEGALEEEPGTDADLTGGDTSAIQTEQDLAEAETGVVEDVSLTGEDALAEQVEQEFGEELVEPAPKQPTAEVVPIEGEEIVMEGPAPEPPLQDTLERQAESERGLTPAERQRTIQALEQELEPESAQAPISAPQAPQEAGKPVQPESPQELDQAAQQAATSPRNKTPEPTEAQIEAGNYKKGKVRLNGMEISVENPKGSTRSGINRKGKQWSRTLKDHYGYIRQSESTDGGQVDVFLTDQAHDTSRPVFVVDQVEPETGSYDEPKAIMGARNEAQARKVYQRNYEDGWQGLGAITQMSQDEFKAWTKGDTTKPVALKEKPTRQPKAEAKPKAEEKEKPAPQKPGKAQQSDLIGQYVRSGSATGKVTAVSDDGKKATLDTGRRVPVGRAPNWAVQSEPFEGAKKRAAKAKAARKSSPPMFSVEQDPAETERLITALLDKDGSERVKALEMESGPFGNVFDYQKNPDGLKKWYRQIAGRIHPDKVDHPRAEEAMAKLDQIRGEVAPSQEDLEKLRKGRERRAKKKAKKKAAKTRETDQGTAMFSVEGESVAQPRGMSVEEVRQQIESRFGKRAIRKLEQSGRFTILNNPGRLDTRVRSRLFGENVTASPAGLYDPKTGKSWLFTDHISSGDAVGVFLHEVGAHYGLKRMIGAKEYRNVKKRLRDLANQGDKRVREAIFRVPEDTVDEYFWDEVLAYLVQHNYKFKDVPSANRAALKDPLVRALRKVVAQIRAFLNELGFLNTRNLTSDDIVALVQGAARHAVRTAPKSGVQGSQDATAMASAPADTFYSQMARALNDKLPNKGTAQSYAKQIRNLAKKGQFKQEELEWSGVLEWLDNFKQTPSRSGRLDEEVLGIEAKRSKVVTKAEVLDFLRANQIRVEEVTKGDGFSELQQAFEREGYKIDRDPMPGVDESDFIDYVNPEGESIEFGELPETLQKAVNEASESNVSPTKFTDYQLPGGENYRELLLTLPVQESPVKSFEDYLSRVLGLDMTEGMTEAQIQTYRDNYQQWAGKNRPVESTFRGAHFDEPNVLAHVRFNERTDADGNRVLFVEELQSDWHQRGRKEGYKLSAAEQREVDAIQRRIDDAGGVLNLPESEQERARELGARLGSEGVPDAPFKQTWPLLAFKRMIRYAAENGFDSIAWTTGEQQAARYDLSNQIDSLNYRKADDSHYEFSAIKNGESVLTETYVPENKIEDYVGKEVAQKIIDGEGAPQPGGGNVKQLSGLDLKVGGEGMKAFYDKMLPSAMNKYVKKWGAKVGDVTIPSQNRLEKSAGTVHALPITPQMREAVMEQGQPLFSKGGKLTPEQKRERLRRLGLNFENLPGDLEGSQARATEPVDQEPDVLSPEEALEELEKQGFDKPMLSVDDDGGEGTLNDPAQQERAQRSLTGNRVTDSTEKDEYGLIIDDPRVDPFYSELFGRGKLYGFFESATDKLRRTGNPIMERLATRVDAYYDRNEARMGWVNGKVRPILKRIPLGKKKAVMRDFEEYWRHHDNGREQEASEVLNRNPIVRQLVTEVKGLYSEMGDLNQKVGVKVYDSSLNDGKGGWRAIGKVPKGKFWPRSFSPKVQRVLANPKNDPELWRQMVDALIEEGHIETPAEASKYLRRYMGREVANDYFSGIEKARQRKLPEMFYDYSWDEFNRYARKWSSRVTQIEQFGQKTSQNTEDLFETVVNSTMDHHTQNYVAALSDHVYSRRSTDIYTTLLQHLNLIATGTQLGNPATATLNFIGGTTLNVQMFGWRRVAKSYANMMQDWKKIQQTGVDLGILGKDVLNILRDTEQSAATYMDASGRVQDSLARFAAFTMKWGGYKGTENIIRMNAMMASWIQLQDALQQWNRNPTGSTSMKYRAFMQRNRIDPDKLLAENGKGPETARYLRLMVNIPQGSYRPDQVPLYVDSPVGRFLFKYQKFGTQVSRMFWQNHLQPFVKTVVGGEKVLLPGQKLQKKTGNIIDEKTGKVVKSNRVRTFLPLLRYFAAALVGGSAILAARSFLFNYNDPGPEWDDLAAALDDEDEGEDRSLMWAMIFDRAYYSLFAASAAGFFGNYIQFLFDFADQQRVKNPLDPPGLASINAVQELVMRAVEQEGNLTARDLDNIGERTLALYRGYKRAGTKAMAMSGSGWKEARLRDAYTDLVYTKKMTRRFADEMDMKGRRTFSGRWGKTPMSPYNQQAYEALLLGDGASAEAVYQQAKQAMEEPGKVAQSMKSSMRARHPWNVGASQAKANHSKFLEWAEKHTSKANYQRIKALGDRYDRARKKAGL